MSIPLRCHHRQLVSVCIGVLTGLICCPALFADPLMAGDGRPFRLGPESKFQQGCFEPCLCPLLEQSHVRGTMNVRYAGSVEGIETYAISDVNWSVPFGEVDSRRVVGAGFYEIGSPGPNTVIMQHLLLELRVGDEPVQRFDSGWVPVERLDGIFITVSVNGMECWDTVFSLAAQIVPHDQIRPYALAPGSTFQRGCWDPCDCLLGPELALGGTFQLIPLVDSLPLTEFAIVNVRWRALADSVEQSLPITGFGVYQLLGDFVSQDRLILELTIGDEAPARFDSGVDFGGSAIPTIDRVVSINGMVCFDTVLHVIGVPDDRDVCGGIAGAPCDKGHFCKLPLGGCCCDFTGVCTEIPTGCPDVWKPVCGCDGNTYGNECEADALGVSIAHLGECAQACGGVLTVDCPKGQFCKMPVGVCAELPNVEGICTPTPDACPEIYDPVCGCDEVTYDNACFAASAGVSLRHLGACEVSACCLPDGFCFEIPIDRCVAGGGSPTSGAACHLVDCGPIGSGACCFTESNTGVTGCVLATQEACKLGGGEYLGDDTTCPTDVNSPCEIPTGACCVRNPDGSGTIICLELTQQQCLSEGGAYRGDHTTCSDAGLDCSEFCGGFTGAVCQDGEYCKFPDGTCGQGDLPGVCTPIPPPGTMCVDVYDPVCGCDNNTYGNACEADLAGISIRHLGECEISSCCFADGNCLEIPPDICLGANGIPFSGVGCDVVNCHAEPIGACCFASPNLNTTDCLELSVERCLLEGGTYLGDDTTCPTDASSPCEIPTGACCVLFSPDGSGTICVESTEQQCRSEGGSYRGDLTTCDNADLVCPKLCGGFTGAVCQDGEYCNYPVGVCGQGDIPGVCTPLPHPGTMCLEVYDPVCGCDNNTYGNACEAERAGISIRHLGECEISSCCFADGNCLEIPPDLCLGANGIPFLGVGCDVVDCHAEPIGACCFASPDLNTTDCLELSVERCLLEGGTYLGDDTNCPTEPNTPCGQVCPADCSSDSSCFDGCGTLVQEGCVVFQAEDGRLFELFDLGGFQVGDRVHVVGCSRPCATPCAIGTCLTVQLIESCGKAVCGGLAGIPCENADDFCKFPAGTCGEFDLFGSCTPIPQACTRDYAPVCGCNGLTYSNECEADAAGVSVRHFGECETSGCFSRRLLSTPEPMYCPGEVLTVEISLVPPPDVSAVALEDTLPTGWTASNISNGGVFDAINGKVKWGPFFTPDVPPVVTYDAIPAADATGLQCFEGLISLDGLPRRTCGESCVDLFCCPELEADSPQLVCPACPANGCATCDDGCQNGHVSLCEVIGYACAWLTGCNDNLGGMTRAAFIWRNGECYCWDEGERNWFPSDCTQRDTTCCSTPNDTPSSGGIAGLGVIDTVGSVQIMLGHNRQIAKTGEFVIPIVIDAPAGTTAVALEVVVGSEWLVSQISDGGKWDSLNGKVKWGPYFDQQSRTVSFTVRRAQGGAIKPSRVRRLAGPTEFFGTVSFDGVNQSITAR